MHIKNGPLKLEKDGEVVFAYYTAEARDYIELGYAKVGAQPEPVESEEETLDLEMMTRADLMKLLDSVDVKYKNNASKAELLKLCEEFEDE